MKCFSFAMAAAVAATLLTTSLVTTSAQAHEHGKMAKAGQIMVSGFWARATPKTAKTSAAYMMIKNAGDAADTLIGASSDIAKKTEIHQSKMEGGMMKMMRNMKGMMPPGMMGGPKF